MSNLIYDAMLAQVKTTRALGQVAGLMSWDQEVMMPPKGAESRAEQAAAIEEVTHERSCNPQLGEWLEQLDGADLDETSAANVRLVRRSYDRANRIPADLASETARVTSLTSLNQWSLLPFKHPESTQHFSLQLPPTRPKTTQNSQKPP